MICLVKAGKFQLISSVLIFLFYCPVLIAQHPPDSGWVRYDPGYKFRDGVYSNIRMVRTNHPIPPARIVTALDRFDSDFYELLLAAEEIVLFDDKGVQFSLKTNELWGYAYMGVLYMQVGGSFQRLLLEGNISRFLASSTTWEEMHGRPPDPHGYKPATATYPNYRRPVYRMVTREGKVYLLDFERNEIKAYHQEALAELLKRDSELYHEYSGLKIGQRNKQMREFINRYNQRHPLFFPAASNN